MGFGGIPVLVLPLLLAVVCANGYYTATTRRPSLTRDLLVRVLLVESLFAFPAFLTPQAWPSFALSAIVLLPIFALTLAFYPLKKRLYPKIR